MKDFYYRHLTGTKTDKKAVHRWRAKNNINGLVYGNGGLVGWDKETCLKCKRMKTPKTREAK